MNKKLLVNYNLFRDYWNKNTPYRKKIGLLSQDDKNKIRIRCNENKDFMNIFIKCIEEIKSNPFLRGDKGKWHVTFRWIIKNDTNYRKILDGDYDHNKGDKNASNENKGKDVYSEYIDLLNR